MPEGIAGQPTDTDPDASTGQQFHRQIKIDIGLQPLLCTLQRIHDRLYSFISASVRHPHDLLNLFLEDQTVHILGSLEKEHVPIPGHQNIQIIIDIEFILGNLLNRLDDLVNLHIIDVFD
ncbi:hypothetical protein IMSAGC012_00349 [Lachnospiraceae bacterium]|nr:hypothetical protein IMSAGC012_00349 [Lachnospiraceae bacterium]